MAFRRSSEPCAQPHSPNPPLAEALFHWLGGQQPHGRLLVHDVASQTHREGAGCTTAAATAAGGGPSSHAGTSPGPCSGQGGMQIVPVDAAFTDVPVPTVFLGGLPAPIPAGRPTIDADVLLRQLQRGQLPSDSLPEGDREAWRAASRITDPISAYNICQAQQLGGGRRVVLTERGVAEQLARGTIQMVPVQDGGVSSSGSKRGRGLALPNPFAPLLKLAAGLSEGRQLSVKVQSRAAALGREHHAKQGSSSSSSSSSSSRSGLAASAPAANAGTSAPPATPPAIPAAEQAGKTQPQLHSGADAEAAPTPPLPQPPQYCLQDMPARRLLAGGSPPQLAWVPLRVALQLLRALPQHFLLLQANPRQERLARRRAAQQQQQGNPGSRGAEGQQAQQQEGQAGQGSSSGGGSSSGSGRGGKEGPTFNARSSPAELEVWVIPGLQVRQLTPDGNSVEFTPAFISHSSAQALWRDMREISGGAMLMYRRLERSLLRRRLEAAAALIASGGALRGGPQAGTAGQEDEEGGMEEPPEISEFIQELGGSIAQEAGSGGSMGGAAMGGGGGLQPPSGLLSRMFATFACGMVSVTAQGLSWAGNTADWLLMASPLGPRLLGVPEATIQQHRLSELVGGMQQYNQEQAVLQSVLSCFSKLGQMSQEGQQGQQGQGQQGQGQQPAATEHGQPAPPAQQGQQGQQQHKDGRQDPSAGASAAPTEELGAQAGRQPAAASPAGPATAGPATGASPTVDTSASHYEGRMAVLAAAETEAVLRYRRQLAAAALWVALSAKSLGEDSQVGGASVGRLLAKAFMQQGASIGGIGGTPLLGGAGGGAGGLLGAQSQVALPSGAPSLHAPAPQPPSSLQEAVEQVLAEGLPVLEHNGFQQLFTAQTSTRGSSSGSSSGTSSPPGSSSQASAAAGAGSDRDPAPSASASAAAATAAAAAGLAEAVAEHCTAETHLGLGAFARDGATGAYRVLPSNPLAPPALGRGLMLVGDLDLGQRQRGRTPGRTAARWLTVGVDDGRKLL